MFCRDERPRRLLFEEVIVCLCLTYFVYRRTHRITSTVGRGCPESVNK